MPPLARLEAIDVTLRYRSPHGSDLVIADALSFRLDPGTITSLLGRNASGKTTILNAIAGLTRPASGRFELDGRAARPGEVGYMFQDYRQTLLPWRTVLGNLCLPLEILKVPRPDHKRRVASALAELGMTVPLNRYPYQLSGGQQQLLALARSLVCHPRLLLLDEPFSALDVERHEDLATKVLRVVESARTTTMLVTHQVQDAILLSDEVLVLRDGRIINRLPVRLPRPRTDSMLESSIARDCSIQLRTWLG